MSIGEVVSAIKRELPKFNNFLIKGFREQEFAKLPEFIAEGYRGCARVISPDLKLVGYRVVSPVERLAMETRMPMALNSVNISYDEAALVAYQFQYHEVTFENHIYIPYILEDGSIEIRGTRYECLLGMTEKLFSVTPDNSGFTTKLIRCPISFWRNTLHNFHDIVTERQFIGNVVCARLYQKQASKTVRPVRSTAILYLLCRYDLPQMLQMFGLPKDAIVYDQTDKYQEDFYYFRAQKMILAKMPTLLKVNKKLMLENRLLHNIVATMLYILGSSQLTNFEDMVTEAQMIYKIILGKILYSPNLRRAVALSYMETHLKSVDDFLDEYTNTMMKASDIHVRNIYEFLVYVVNNIDKIIMTNAPNNLFNKKLDTINNAVIDGMFAFLYKQVYTYELKNDHNYMVKEVVTKALRTKQRQILKTLNQADNVRFNPSVQSDNWLITVGSKVVKRLNVTNMGAGKKASSGGIKSSVNRFHPSMLLLESVYGLGSRPGVNSLINPFCQIDELGAFIKTPAMEKVENELGAVLSGKIIF